MLGLGVAYGTLKVSTSRMLLISFYVSDLEKILGILLWRNEKHTVLLIPLYKMFILTQIKNVDLYLYEHSQDVSSSTLHIHTLPDPTPMPTVFPDIAEHDGRYSDGNHIKFLDPCFIQVLSALRAIP